MSEIQIFESLHNLGVIVEVGTRDPTSLKVAPTNNRTEQISEREKLELRTSVENIGVIEPILLNINDEIVSGQLRWASAIASGVKQVPIIKMKFNDLYSERVASIIQDYHHHPLVEKDRGVFVKKCVEQDGRSMQQIADSLGVHVRTIREWAKFESIPEILKGKEEAIQTFFDLSTKKRRATESILNKKPYKDDTKKSLEMIKFA